MAADGAGSARSEALELRLKNPDESITLEYLSWMGAWI